MTGERASAERLPAEVVRTSGDVLAYLADAAEQVAAGELAKAARDLDGAQAALAWLADRVAVVQLERARPS